MKFTVKFLFTILHLMIISLSSGGETIHDNYIITIENYDSPVYFGEMRPVNICVEINPNKSDDVKQIYMSYFSEELHYTLCLGKINKADDLGQVINRRQNDSLVVVRKPIERLSLTPLNTTKKIQIKYLVNIPFDLNEQVKADIISEEYAKEYLPGAPLSLKLDFNFVILNKNENSLIENSEILIRRASVEHLSGEKIIVSNDGGDFSVHDAILSKGRFLFKLRNNKTVNDETKLHSIKINMDAANIINISHKYKKMVNIIDVYHQNESKQKFHNIYMLGGLGWIILGTYSQSDSQSLEGNILDSEYEVIDKGKMLIKLPYVSDYGFSLIKTD